MAEAAAAAVAHSIEQPTIDGALWYAVVAKPQGEIDAERALKAKGYDAWLPLCVVEHHPRHIGRARIEACCVPLYPRYLLVHLEPQQGVYGVLLAPGVSNIVRTRAGLCLPIPGAIVEGLRAWINAEGGALDLRPRTVRQHYQFGDELRIHQGSFASFIGTVISSRAGKIKLRLAVFGRDVVLTVPASAVSSAAGLANSGSPIHREIDTRPTSSRRVCS